jgi:cytochrome c oxidase subunit II
MYQQIAWYTTVFLVFLLLLAFSFVYGESQKLKDYGPIQEKGYKIRKYYFIGLVAIMVFMSAVTLSKLPYHDPHHVKAENAHTVKVNAMQYAWEFSDENFVVGEPVEFIVTSKDVTHGFGLYDPELKLIAQTQAMPGYENTVHVTFTKPGTYKILCLEYCSVGHHVMMKEIVVKPKGGSENE